MNVLHLTPKTNGYEVVRLIANNISNTNLLALIEKDGQKFVTGGLIINDTEEIRKCLDAIDKDKQYAFVLQFKEVPFVNLSDEEYRELLVAES